MTEPARWDIFCRVVDNYGDSGVCWRLARELATAHTLDVTLWQDDLSALARIAPQVRADRDSQQVAGLTLRRWSEPFTPAAVADVIIEAFGCGLPEPYLAAMVERPVAPRWFVLEYLSAESWIERTHGLASPHPRLPLPRHFWFPGFTPATGGVLRERGLVETRTAFTRDRRAQRAFWESLALPAVVAGEIRVPLFCYPNRALPELLDAWADGDAPVSCIVPAGVAAGALDRWTGGAVPRPGVPVVRGPLTVHSIPFLEQDRYDRMLWSSTLNFVRGEDSFVRAQWAARPLVWHIYPQTEGAHWRKLDAFLDRYTAGLGAAPAKAAYEFWHAWNGVPGAPPIGRAWHAFAAATTALERHARVWAGYLGTLPDLTAGLVKASHDRV